MDTTHTTENPPGADIAGNLIPFDLKKYRDAHNLTAEDIIAKLKAAGYRRITRSIISAVENEGYGVMLVPHAVETLTGTKSIPPKPPTSGSNVVSPQMGLNLPHNEIYAEAGSLSLTLSYDNSDVSKRFLNVSDGGSGKILSKIAAYIVKTYFRKGGISEWLEQ